MKSPARPAKYRPHLEVLEAREVPAVQVLPDVANGILTIRGDSKAQNIIVLEVPNATTSINIDSNGDGALDMFLDSTLMFGGTEFNLFNFDLGGGNDRVEIRLLRELDGRARNYSMLDRSGNNSFIFDSNGFDLINGTSVNIEYNGGRHSDSVTANVDGISDSSFNLTANLSAGNDQLNYMLRGQLLNSQFTTNMNGSLGIDAFNLFITNAAIMDNSNLAVTCNLADGNDAFSVSINSMLIGGGSTMTYNCNSGAGNDIQNYRLNGGLGFDSSVTLNGDLGTGHDTFVSTLGYDAYFDSETSRALFNVNGGSGNDNFTIVPFTLGFPGANVNGEVAYNLNLGAGNDTITYSTKDLIGTTGANLIVTPTGRLSVNIDGSSGNDRFNLILDLSEFSDPAGAVNFQALGGAGNDQVNFSGSDPAQVTYLPGGFAFFDGGTGTNIFNLLFNNPLGEVPLNVVNFV